MQEFILAETSEIIETLHPYGYISSDKWVYRIVANVEDTGEVFIEYQCGCQSREYDEIEFEDCEPHECVDFNKKDFNIDELKRFNDALICK